MKISFLIRTYNEEENLGRALELIYSQLGKHKIQVVIVDSGSTDNTLVIARKYECEIIHILPENFTWGYSLNLGFNQAISDYIVVISAHCFLTSLDFINNLEILTKTYPNIVAFYGKQKPIKNYDPFEERELAEWYPDIEEIIIDKSRLFGVSNACAVVKKAAWIAHRFDENVPSLEDGIWATSIVSFNSPIMYTNKISVFHSHPFDASYIYRKWYWRTYESNLFLKKFLFSNVWKNKVKNIFYRYYLFIKTLFELIGYKKFFQNKYAYISYAEIFSFLRIKNLAIYNAYIDSENNKECERDYWKLDIPILVDVLSRNLNKLQEKLKNERSSLYNNNKLL